MAVADKAKLSLGTEAGNLCIKPSGGDRLHSIVISNRRQVGIGLFLRTLLSSVTDFVRCGRVPV